MSRIILRQTKFASLLLAFIFPFFFTVAAQPVVKGEITGQVFDKTTGKPLEYATVAVVNDQTGKVVTGTIADAKGNFRIQNVPAGTYRIDVDFIGYEKNSVSGVTVTNSPGSVSIGTIYLAESTHSLSSVVVTADKPVVESKIDKIVYNAAVDVTSQGGLAIDVLKKVPQVSVDIDGNVELQGNSNIKFLINGKPSSIFGSNVADALASIPASQIKSIEAITNPGARYDSQGTGGIINIILQDNKMQGVNTNVNLSAGSRLENGSVNLNVRHGNFGVNAFFSGQAQLQSKVLTSQSRVSYDSVAHQYTTLNQDGSSQFDRNGFRSGLGFDWNITKNDNLTGSVGFNRFSNSGSGIINQDEFMTDLSNAVLSDVKTIRNTVNSMRFSSLDMSLAYKKKFRKDGQELNILYNMTDGTPHSDYSLTQTYVGDQLPYMGSASINPGTDREIEVSLDYSQPVNDRILLETGVKSGFYDINSIADATKYSILSDQFITDPLQSYNMKYRMNVYAGYLSTDIKLGAMFSLKAGVRYEHTGVTIDFPNTNIPSYGTFVPSTVLAWNINKTSTLKLSYSRRIERPEYRELNPFLNLSDPYNITTGNPLLKPEFGNNFELGYNTSFKKGGNLYVALIERINTQDKKQITTFYPTFQVGDSLYKNVSVSDPQNVGEEYNTGVSISGSYPITKKLNIRGNLMVFHRYSVNDLAGNQSTGVRTRLNGNLSWQLPKDLVIEGFGFYNAPSRSVQGKVPQFFIYTLALRKQFLHKNASIGFTATNFLNKYVKQEITITTPNSNAYTLREIPIRSFGISFTYKFGKLEFKQNNNNNEEDNGFMNAQNASR